MRRKLKKIIAVISISILTAIMASGCVNEPELTAEPVALAKPAPEAPAVPLEQVLAANSNALQFAGEQRDFLEGDSYLAYVIDAKERDAAEQERKKAAALQRAINEAQAALNSEASSTSPSQ